MMEEIKVEGVVEDGGEDKKASSDDISEEDKIYDQHKMLELVKRKLKKLCDGFVERKQVKLWELVVILEGLSYSYSRMKGGSPYGRGK